VNDGGPQKAVTKEVRRWAVRSTSETGPWQSTFKKGAGQTGADDACQKAALDLPGASPAAQYVAGHLPASVEHAQGITLRPSSSTTLENQVPKHPCKRGKTNRDSAPGLPRRQ
jgi:hypothetical protein